MLLPSRYRSVRAALALAALALVTSSSAALQLNTVQVGHLDLGNDMSTADLAVEGNYAYVAREELGCDILDISNPSAPSKVLTLNPDPNGIVEIHDVVVHGGHLYLIDGSGEVDTNLGNFVGVYIYDIATPTAPTLAGYLLWGDLNVPWSWRAAMCHSGFVSDIGNETFLFVSSEITGSVEIFDVTTPSAPVWKATAYDPNNWFGAHLHDMVVVDGMLYSAWRGGGFEVHDVSNVGSAPYPGDPYVPQTSIVHVLSHPYAGANTDHVWPTKNGDYLCVTDLNVQGYMRIFDISNPGNVFEETSWASGSAAIAHQVRVEGDLAYLSYWEDGLHVVDVTDPTAPTHANWFDTSLGAPISGTATGAWGVQPDGNRVYVSDTTEGFFIIDLVTSTDVVTITKLRWNKKKRKLTVWATSSDQPNVSLTAVGLGPLAWNANKGRYQGKFTLPAKPASVTVVSSGGGSDTAVP